MALGGNDNSENLAALRASCGTQCAFDVDEAALRVVVRAPDASACAVAAEMVASIANREFTGMVTKKNLSNRFAAGMRAAEMLRTRRGGGGRRRRERLGGYHERVRRLDTRREGPRRGDRREGRDHLAPAEGVGVRDDHG